MGERCAARTPLVAVTGGRAEALHLGAGVIGGTGAVYETGRVVLWCYGAIAEQASCCGLWASIVCVCERAGS